MYGFKMLPLLNTEYTQITNLCFGYLFIPLTGYRFGLIFENSNRIGLHTLLNAFYGIWVIPVIRMHPKDKIKLNPRNNSEMSDKNCVGGFPD